MADDRYVIDLEARDKASEAMDKAERGVRNLEDEIEDLRGEMDKSSKSTAGYADVLAGNLAAEGFQIVLEGASEAARSIINFTGEIKSMSHAAKAAGTSFKTYQELKLVFEEIGLEGRDLQETLSTLAERGYDAAQGATGLQEDFNSLGITVDQIRGKRPGELFKIVAARLREVEDPTKRLKGAVALLGDEIGNKLASDLGQNDRSMKQMIERFKETNQIVGKETVDDAKRAQDEWRRLKNESAGLATQLKTSLIPAFEAVSGVAADAVQYTRDGLQEKLGTLSERSLKIARLSQEELAEFKRRMEAIGVPERVVDRLRKLGKRLQHMNDVMGDMAVTSGQLRSGDVFGLENLPETQPEKGDGGGDTDPDPKPKFRLTSEMVKKQKEINSLKEKAFKAEGKEAVRLEKKVSLAETELKLMKLQQKIRLGLVSAKKAEVKQSNLAWEKTKARGEAERKINDLTKERVDTIQELVDKGKAKFIKSAEEAAEKARKNELAKQEIEILKAQDPIRKAQLKYELKKARIQDKDLTKQERKLALLQAERAKEQAITAEKKKQAQAEADKMGSGIRAAGSALTGFGSSAGEAAGMVSQRGSNAVQKLQQKKQGASKARKRVINQEIEATKRQTRAVQQQISAYGDLSKQLGSMSGDIAELAEQQWDFSSASDAAAGAVGAVASAGGAAAQLMGDSVSEQAGIKAAFEAAASVASFAAYAASGGTAGNLLAAGIQHGTASTMYGAISAGSAGKAGNTAPSTGGGASGPVQGGPAGGGAGSIDMQKEREKSAQAFAQAMRADQESRNTTINVDMAGATTLEESDKTAGKIVDAVDRYMQDSRLPGGNNLGRTG